MNNEEFLNQYAKEIAPMFQMMFPMIHGVAVIASKIQTKAYLHGIYTTKEQKREIARIEDTAKRLRWLCEQYVDKYLVLDKYDDERNRVDETNIFYGNLYIRFLMMLQNAYMGQASEDDILRIETALKLACRNTKAFGVIQDEVLNQFKVNE